MAIRSNYSKPRYPNPIFHNCLTPIPAIEPVQTTSPFSKVILIQKNVTTLHEPTRGVDLELIKASKDALKYTQNGYETTIKRVIPKTDN